MIMDVYEFDCLIDYLRFIDILGINRIPLLTPEYKEEFQEVYRVISPEKYTIINKLTKHIKYGIIKNVEFEEES